MDDKILYQVMDVRLLDAEPDQWGVTIHQAEPKSLGFATTLTPAVIRQAISKNLQLLVTHHDAWDFMREEQPACQALLAEHKISHIWCHSPLDKNDYGTAAAMMNLLDCTIIAKIAEDCGRVGELPAQTQLAKITEKLEGHLSEQPCRSYDARRPVSRIACVPGAGMRIDYMAEALQFDIDLYITGETSLYLLEYAVFRQVNALIYSHNYTEIFGTQNLAWKIAEQLAITQVVRLDEPHF